jgi:hypothetical protein
MFGPTLEKIQYSSIESFRHLPVKAATTAFKDHQLGVGDLRL